MLRITGFLGANKALHPLLLPPGVCADSKNQRPGRGDLRPWHNALGVATVPTLRQTIYRMGRDAPNDATFWLSWTTDVDVARGLTADDATERTFWSGSGAPQWTDNVIGLTLPPYPTASRTLGVPPPTALPTVSVIGGAASANTRYYVWTWVTDKGEESAPSPLSAAITGPTDATFRVTFDNAIPSNRGINRKRLYRTTTGSSGATAFYFLTEVVAATTQFDDLNTTPVEPLPSTSWLEPPATLAGLKPLWNGMLAGFVGKSVRFSEPYRPFAWPLQYELVVDDLIVALGVWQQNLLVLTTGRPYLITGSEPASMSLQPLELEQSCIAKRSVVQFGHGVVWASPDGLVYMGGGGARVITAPLMLREDWQALIPSSFIGAQYEGAYMASYDPGTGRVGFVIDPVNPQGVFFLSTGFDAAFRDSVSDALYVLNATAVNKWDAAVSFMTASMQSRTELLPRPMCFSFARVIADAYPVTFSLIADGVTRVNARAVNDGLPFRLPAGFLADKWRVDLSTQNAVQAVLLGHSAAEMQQAT